MQRKADIPLGTDGRVGFFFGRPFRVIHGERIAAALLAAIVDVRLRRLARTPPIGSIDLISDSTDVLENELLRPALRALYQSL
jgi:hypothetical protein